MGQVTWAMMPCPPAGSQHFLRIAVVTGVHHRGSGDNGMAVSLTHLDWNWMEPRRENTCQQAVSDHALWVIIQLGAMRGLERNIPLAVFARAFWESAAAARREGHPVRSEGPLEMDRERCWGRDVVHEQDASREQY